MTPDDNSWKHSSNDPSDGGGGSDGSGDPTRDNSANEAHRHDQSAHDGTANENQHDGGQGNDAAGEGSQATEDSDSSAGTSDAQSAKSHSSEEDFETREWQPVQAWSEVRNPDGSVSPRSGGPWGNSQQWNNAGNGGGSGWNNAGNTGWNNGGGQQWNGGAPGGWNGQPGQSQYGGQYGAAQNGAGQWSNPQGQGQPGQYGQQAQYGQGQYNRQPQYGQYNQQPLYSQNAQYGQGQSGGSSAVGSQGESGQSGSSIWKVLLPIILIFVVVAALIGALMWKPWEKLSNDGGAPGSESSAIPEEPSNEPTEDTTTEPEDTETATEDTTTERRTTTTTTTSSNHTGTDIPGLGRQGFTDNSAATCNADDEWVYAGINEDGDKVVICQVGDTDGFYYRGWYHGGALERDVTSRGSDGRSYTMKSGGTVINIDGSTLNVVQNGKTVSSSVFDGVATREPDWG